MDFIIHFKDFIMCHLTLITQIVIHLTLIGVVVVLIDKAILQIKQKIYTNKENVSLLNLLIFGAKIAKVIAILLILGSFLQCQGYSLTSIMTGLGITGLAVGLAAKEMLASFLGSISIMSDKVYKIGDYVSINNVEGLVESVNFRSTKIRTIANTLITIPNNITADTIVHNRSESEYFRLIEKFDIEYSTSDEKVQEALDILSDICDKEECIQDGHLTMVSALGENAITLQLIANTRTNQWMKFLDIKDRLYKTVLKRFRQNGISFAFPSRTVYVRKDED